MIKVYVKKQSHFPIKSTVIKKRLSTFLKERGMVSDCLVSVALVGKKKMLDISDRYLKDKKVHNVLSFTEDEAKDKFIYPPDKIYLGEIIICFPKAIEEAKSEEKRIDEKVAELIEHGALHLMGIHHG